jgi:hypothetical protein
MPLKLLPKLTSELFMLKHLFCYVFRGISRIFVLVFCVCLCRHRYEIAVF